MTKETLIPVIKSSKNLVPALNSSIRVLELLATREFSSANLTEISTALSINKSTCLRILRTLEANGYVILEDVSKTYSLGSPLIALGNRAREVNDYIKVASTYLKDLTKNGLTFVLVKRVRGGSLMYVAKEEPDLKVRLTVSTGDSFPIPAGALGKCFYSFLPEEEAKYIIENSMDDDRLPQYTSHSVVSVDELGRQASKIRIEGIAESHEEYSPGISAYACPIFNNEGEIVLGLGSYIPKSLSGEIDSTKLKSLMKTTANEITEAISSLV